MEIMESKKHVFTQIEKRTFMEILKKYRDIVESKETDSTSLRVKNVTWNEIATEFNSNPEVQAPATNKQLRRLWMNLKQRQREALLKKRQRMVGKGEPSATNGTAPDVTELARARGIIVDDFAADEDSAIYSDAVPAESDSRPPPSSKNEEQVDVKPILYPDPLSVTIETGDHLPPVTVQSQTPAPIGVAPCQSLAEQYHKQAILEKEYSERKVREDEKHNLEKLLLREKIRKAKAEADKAELMLIRLRQSQYYE